MADHDSSAMRNTRSAHVSGTIGAAIMAAGVGCLVIGLMTIGAEMSTGLKNILNWWNPAGPLSGKTGVGVIFWLLSWAVLHAGLKNRVMHLKTIMVTSLILIGVGILLTFPPIFTAFGH